MSSNKAWIPGVGYNPVAGPSSTGGSASTLSPKNSQTSTSINSSPSGSLKRSGSLINQGASIYDRNLHRSSKQVSLSSLSFLFMQIISMNLNSSQTLLKMERKLNNLGYSVGIRILELVSLREDFDRNITSSSKYNSAKRETKILEMLQFVGSSIWMTLFGKNVDNLEKSVQNKNQYMIIDNDPLMTKFISVPKEYEGLDCESFVAGIIEGILDVSYFRCEVSAHVVPIDKHPNRTVYLINFDESVITRESRLK